MEPRASAAGDPPPRLAGLPGGQDWCRRRAEQAAPQDQGGLRRTGGPAALPRASWADTLKRTLKKAKDDKINHWGAALTYYAVLALFPALLALVALVGIFGQYPQTTDALIDVAKQVSGGNSAAH